MSSVIEVPVSTPIRLGQFLQLAAVAESGIHARDIIGDGDVLVDDDVELRRGRQLHGGERVAVTLGGTQTVFAVVVDHDSAP